MKLHKKSKIIYRYAYSKQKKGSYIGIDVGIYWQQAPMTPISHESFFFFLLVDLYSIVLFNHPKPVPAIDQNTLLMCNAVHKDVVRGYAAVIR